MYDPPVPLAFGDLPALLKLLREAARMTQEEAGAAVGMSHQSIGNWEKGSREPLLRRGRRRRTSRARSGAAAVTSPADPPKKPPRRLRITGLRVSIDEGRPALDPNPDRQPETAQRAAPAQFLEPDNFPGRDPGFEAECASGQEADDRADWEAAQPGANVFGFDALKRCR